MMKSKAAALTSTGRVRNSNEDAFGYLSEHGIYIVCDGMGGAAGGEVASRMAVDTVLRRMTAEGGASDHQLGREKLHQAIAEANQAVQERSEREPGLYGMGTTLVALLLGVDAGASAESASGSGSGSSPGSGPALIAHAGDSRCYLYRGGKLSRITHDHSLVDEQMRLGTITPEEAERSPFRSVITRAIGTQKSVTEDMIDVEVQKGDVFLLCTDGLTREVPERRIADLLEPGAELEVKAQSLIDAANEAGGRDNVTCLLVRVE
jgi:protein phosphatase